MMSRRVTNKGFAGFSVLLRKFRSSFNAYSDLEKGKAISVVVVSRSRSGTSQKWPNTKLGPIDSINPKYPLPGFVGLPVPKDEKLPERKYTPAVHTLPPLKEEKYAAVLLDVHNAMEFNDSQPSIIPLISDQLECSIHTCPTLVQRDLANVFPSRKLSTTPLTALILSHHTNESLNMWSEEAADEREQLAQSFITSAIEICASLKELGYWADFIDPFTGKPYIGAHGEAVLTETDETMKHFGFELDNSVCCKMLRHPKWKNHLYRLHSSVLQTVLQHFKDYFGIENDQENEAAKHQKAKCKALTASISFIDDQYFGDHGGKDNDKACEDKADNSFVKDNPREKMIHSSKFDVFDELSEVDSQYFAPSSSKSSMIGNSMPITDSLSMSKSSVIRPERKSHPHRVSPIVNVSKNSSNRKKQNIHLEKPVHDSSSSLTQDDELEYSEENDNDDDNYESDPVEYGADTVRIVRQRTKLNLYTGTTLDVSSNNKQGSSIPEKLDSHGYRVPDEDIFKFDFLTEEEAAMVLYKSIIDIRENVIIMNKPYGIASQPGNNCKHNIIDLLPRVELIVRKNRKDKGHGDAEQQQQPGELSLVHRLDKDSSGIMLIARNRDAALKLQEAYSRRWIKKDYLCVTVGIPRSEYGYIQLPLIERNFSGIRKMCIPKLDRHTQEKICKEMQLDVDNHMTDGHTTEDCDITDAISLLQTKMQVNKNPITWYHMLDKRNSAALMLCSTLTGVKHQIRAHLAFGLQTPILGDHKYSHAEYLAPQRLPKYLLEALKVRQSKVRYLGLHLHASSVHFRVTPTTSLSSMDGGDFFNFIRSKGSANSMNNNRGPLKFYAPLPNHFRDNLKRIGLKLPGYLRQLYR
uniref:Pseudouridine synthase RsuA/RluA-like domain-containing protein n=1 Tax=Trichobilharzia regenti TaxID=157069 RepID=A0AA85KA88_TRIRE|nr:unnamed protein product [Trichobilharzia regenti]